MTMLKKFFAITLFFTTIALPQNKLFNTEDVIFNSYTKLAPKVNRSVAWIPNSNSYSYLKTIGEKQVLFKSYVNSNAVDTVYTLKRLNSALTINGFDELEKLPSSKWIDNENLRFTSNGSVFLYNYKTYKLKFINKIKNNAENISFAPNSIYAAYTIGNNLYASFTPLESTAITNDKIKGIVNGKIVHRNEFGINKGIFWSPKSNYIAFYRKDETMVTDYPIVDYTTTPASLKSIKYPMAGQKSHQVKLGVYAIASGKTVWMKTGMPLDHYLTSVTWDPSEKYIYIGILNRDQNHLYLNKYDAKTGNFVKTLFEETDDKYVQPLHPMYFIPGQADKFLWFSHRDGWNHLYLYNTNGRLLRQVTKGKWEVISIDGFDKNNRRVFITSTKDGVMDRNFYAVDLSGGIERITKTQGWHYVKPNSTGKYFLNSYTSKTIPNILNILNYDGKIVKNISKSPNPIKDYKRGRLDYFTLKDKAGFDLYCRMYYPVDFDSTKKYPVIVYVYGGPGVQLVTDTWPRGRYAFWFMMMAQKGYIVFTLDNRGSANRGKEFEQATFRHLGTKEIEDQLVGVNYLKSKSFVDPNRFGVFGWSYGGFMTTSLMTRTNDAFKVGACGGAVIDWKYYEVMYTERYMDTPQTNPEGYKEASLLNYVQNLHGKLLLVHGTSDPTVMWQNTLEFAKKAADLDIPLDYFPYVGHLHGVYGKDALHLYNKITKYFEDNL